MKKHTVATKTSWSTYMKIFPITKERYLILSITQPNRPSIMSEILSGNLLLPIYFGAKD
jgi:hypothetical protein